MRDQPVQQPPVVVRLRIRYAKRGRTRFASHRDFARAFERAVRRAALPVAYSSGFSPHPRISYANAASTGAASEAEYLEIGLTEEVDPAAVQSALDAALPDGLDIVDVVVAGGSSLADRLEASSWRISLPGIEPAVAEAAVADFLQRHEVEVSRLTKRGVRSFDCRQPVVSLAVSDNSDAGRSCAILELVVRHGTPTVRPDDILAGLREIAGLEPSGAPLLTRLAQGPLDPQTGAVGDPLAADRAPYV